MAYVRSRILISDNKQEYLSHYPWNHGTSLMWAPRVWCCVTDFSSLTILLEYLATYKIRAQSLSPDDKYQIIFDFVVTCHEPLDRAYLIFGRCGATFVPTDSFYCAGRVSGCRQSPNRTGRLRIAQIPWKLANRVSGVVTNTDGPWMVFVAYIWSIFMS